MNCFTHQQTVAVGTCKNCGRGLCASCAVALDDGLACAGRCESVVRDLNALLDRNMALAPAASIPWSRNGWLYVLMGAAFLWFGFSNEMPLASFLLVFGGLLVAGGFVNLLWAWRIKNARRDAA